MNRIDQLKAYLKNTDKDSFLQHALALEYIKIGNDKEAERLFEELLAREPTYIGSYYHLGKLLERIGNNDKALVIYLKGMEKAKEADDRHSYVELQAAWEDLNESI